MKMITKVALAGLALAASSAHADVALPSTGNGELVLFVKDTVSGAVYARGLGITMDNILSASAISGGSYTGPVQAFAYSIPTITADNNWNAFVAANTGSKVWAIMGGDNQGGITVGTGVRYATTSQLATAPAPTNINLTSGFGNLNTFLVALNGQLPDTGENSVFPNGLWDQAAGGSLADSADQWFATSGTGSVNNAVTGLGTTAKFYVVTASGGTTSAAARVYQAVDLRLNANGTLEAVGGGGPEVPLPPALWLLGSALVGMAGVARRRQSAPATAAA